jgi:Retroviral aspartyl protease
VLVDSGASHSFVPASVVHVFQFPVCESKDSAVTLPNGAKLMSAQTCKLQIEYIPTKFTESIKFYVLPMEGCLILGGDWLRGNEVVMDYS